MAWVGNVEMGSLAVEDLETNDADGNPMYGLVVFTQGPSNAPRFAVISAPDGNTTVVPAVSGKKIRVLDYTMVSDAVSSVRFESDTGGTALTGVMQLISSTVLGGTGILQSGFNPMGHFETVAGELLNLEVTAASGSVTGHLTYIEV